MCTLTWEPPGGRLDLGGLLLLCDEAQVLQGVLAFEVLPGKASGCQVQHNIS